MMVRLTSIGLQMDAQRGARPASTCHVNIAVRVHMDGCADRNMHTSAWEHYPTPASAEAAGLAPAVPPKSSNMIK